MDMEGKSSRTSRTTAVSFLLRVGMAVWLIGAFVALSTPVAALEVPGAKATVIKPEPGVQTPTEIEHPLPTRNPSLSPTDLPEFQQIIRRDEIVLSGFVLAFGLVVLGFVNWGAHRMGSNPEGGSSFFEALVGLNAVTIVVTATMFLVTAGYSDRQIAPAMGLLGTIVGYILGTRSYTVKERVVTGSVDPKTMEPGAKQ